MKDEKHCYEVSVRSMIDEVPDFNRVFDVISIFAKKHYPDSISMTFNRSCCGGAMERLYIHRLTKDQRTEMVHMMYALGIEKLDIRPNMEMMEFQNKFFDELGKATEELNSINAN